MQSNLLNTPDGDTQNISKSKKKVSISMNETPGNFISRYKNKMQRKNNVSPPLHAKGRSSIMASPKTALSNRSTTTVKSYNFRIGHSNKSNRFTGTSPRNPYYKKKSRAATNEGYAAALQKEYQHEQFHMQTISKLMKEIEDIKMLYQSREEKLNNEIAQEREMFKLTLANKDQKIKDQEANIHMLETLAQETESTGKTKVEHFESTIQECVKKLQDEQSINHQLK